jgi:hypothetical protein
MRRREFVAGLILAPLPHSIAVFMTQRVQGPPMLLARAALVVE